MASKYQYVTEFVKLVGRDYPEGPETVQGYFINHHVQENQEARYLLEYWGSSVQMFVVCRHPHSAIPCLAAQGIIPTATITALPESATGIMTSDERPDSITPDPEGPAVGFIWHGSDALSAIGWFSWFSRILTKAQLTELNNYVKETFM